MELKPGMTTFSEGTFACSNSLCNYNDCGRCIYNVARLQIRVGKACYHELCQDEIECEADYAQGLL